MNKKNKEKLLMVKHGDTRAIVSYSDKKPKIISCSGKNNCGISKKNCPKHCKIISIVEEFLSNGEKSNSIHEIFGEVMIGIGEYYVGKRTLIKTIGLGSCVAVALYDQKKPIGGLAHIMLPGASENGKAKYAGVAIEKMLEDMRRMGAKKNRIVAKLAGGAQVFKHITLDVLKIGERNIISVEENLKKEGIEIIGKDTGGSVGRSVFFSTADGSLLVRTSPGDERWL